MPENGAGSAAFDAVAASYDADFTRRRLGRWLRRAVRRRLADAFRPGDRVLELGCGTGEDALWLSRRGVRVVALDTSPRMLAEAHRKLEAAGRIDDVQLVELDLAELPATAPGEATFDGAFSNFGVLNCVPDRAAVARTLAAWVRPGGRLVLVVMGPFCPWEIASHLVRGRPRIAFRRLLSGRGGLDARVGQAAVRVWYPSPARLRREFDEAGFRVLETAGIGALLPTSELAGLVDRRPSLFGRLGRLERRLDGRFPLTWLNDHFLLVLERR